MKDIALEVGLSSATVSRAISNPGQVSPEKRQQIQAAIDRLDYRPNLAAKALRRQSSQLILVVVPQLSPFFLGVFNGVERAAEELGYTALMGHSARDPRLEEQFFRQLLSRKADGALLVSTGLTPLQASPGRPLPPLVAMLETIDGADLPTVRVDNAAAAREAVEHLIALGHRRIAHVTGPLQMAMVQHRLAGFRAAIAAADIDPRTAYVVGGDFSIASGEAAAERLLTRHPRPTAIFAGNDEMAVGVLQGLKRAGVAIGTEISVIGFDDQRMANIYRPSLTTMHVPMAELGYRAMRLLHEVIVGEASPMRDIVLPTELIVRETTGPVRADPPR